MAEGVLLNVLLIGFSTSLLINWVTFSSKVSSHLHSQAVWARDMKFWENVQLPPHVTCQVSSVRCQVSGVRCQVWFFFTMWWSLLVEGLFSMGPTPSSLTLHILQPMDLCNLLKCDICSAGMIMLSYFIGSIYCTTLIIWNLNEDFTSTFLSKLL